MAWANQQHMNDGIKAAIASPNTPKHLRAHLAKRLAPTNDPLSPNDIADNDNLAPEQQRGLRVAAKRITAAPGRKSIEGRIISSSEDIGLRKRSCSLGGVKNAASADGINDQEIVSSKPWAAKARRAIPLRRITGVKAPVATLVKRGMGCAGM